MPPASVILPKDEDRDDLDRFLAGSDEAFIRLYAKYEAPLLLYCKRMADSDQVGEDAFQEVWIRFFELRNKKLEIDCFRSVLFRSARNMCFNALRVERLNVSDPVAIAQAVSSDSSSAAAEQEEMKDLLRRALQKLPFRQREAFVLHEYSGYSYIEISEMMQTTELNVKVRAYRARLRLRQLISSWLGLEEEDDPTNAI